MTKTQYDDFWIDTLEPYGTSERGWLCPSIARRQQSGELDADDNLRLHLLPAEFDDKQFTPNEYPGMPWAMEIGSFHGGGNLLIRADGQIRDLNDLLEQAGQSGLLDLRE